MKSQTKAEREIFWTAQLSESQQRSGTLEEFCRERGLSISTYQNWKRRLTQKKKALPKPPAAFVPIQVEARASKPQIDPQWLAQLVLQLHRGE